MVIEKISNFSQDREKWLYYTMFVYLWKFVQKIIEEFCENSKITLDNFLNIQLKNHL